MRAIRLPNGNPPIPVETDAADNTDAGDGLHGIRPDDPEYGRWLAF